MTTSTLTSTNDVFIEILGYKKEAFKVLIVGNNPSEMAAIYGGLSQITTKNYMVDVCFDVADCFSRALEIYPEVILIDDNLDGEATKKLIHQLRNNAFTRHTPIIFLKGSNWNFTVMEKVDDYILKSAIDPKTLDRVISGKVRKTQQSA